MAKGYKPKVGDKVILKGLPDKISHKSSKVGKERHLEKIGRPHMLTAYEPDGRAELEFSDSNGVIHYIYVNSSFISAIPRTKLKTRSKKESTR